MSSKKTPSTKSKSSKSKRPSSSQRELEDEALDAIQKRQPKTRSSKRPTSSTRKRKRPSKTKDSKTRKQKRATKKSPRKKTRSSRWSDSSIVFFRFILSSIVGLIGGLGMCAYATFVAAEHDVEEWLVPSNHTTNVLPAQILSAPYTVEPKVNLELDAFVDLLQASGYSQVQIVEKPGDMQVKENSVVIDNRLKHTKVQERIEIFFDSKGVLDILNNAGQKKSSAKFAPAVLTKLRGPQENKKRIPYEQIPEIVPQAILAVEDSRFYQHEGLDYIGLTRAVVVNLLLNKKSQGASTITQQLVKNLILNNSEKTYNRKAKEALRALALEKKLSKKELIELYMNEVYLGQVNGRPVIGVGQAAEVYFGKQIDRLTIGEAGMLAGIISAPNAYSPSRHPDRALKRRNSALKRLLAVYAITQEVYDVEISQPLLINVIPKRRRANYFVDGVIEHVESQLGEGSIASLKLQVFTTLDPIAQVILEHSVATQLADLETKHPQAKNVQVAAVVLDGHTGEIKAMVGGRGYESSQFNRALYGKRQVGSLSKPLLYAQLFEQETMLSPGCWVKDESMIINYDGTTWAPSNYDKQFLGQVTLREALKKSRNLPSVSIYQHLQKVMSPDFFVELGTELHLEIGPAPSASLGSFTASVLDMASAYTIFSNQGVWISPKWVREIDATNQDVPNIVSPTSVRIVPEHSAWLVEDILRDVVDSGTAKSSARYGATGALAAKTGTTNNGRDAWLVGYDPKHILAVWVGHDKGEALGLGGSQAALPIWADWMSSSNPSRQSEFKRPKGLVQKSVCAEWELCDSTQQDWFLRGTYRQEQCALFEFTHSKTGLVERLLPKTSVKSDEVGDSKEEESDGGFFRLFPWNRNR